MSTFRRSDLRSFNIRDLRQRTGELVRGAESGDLAVVTKHGHPVFVAVPMSERLLEAGVFEVLAVKLYADGVLSLSKAAKLASSPVERFLETLAASGVDAVSYPPEELDEELASFG